MDRFKDDGLNAFITMKLIKRERCYYCNFLIRKGQIQVRIKREYASHYKYQFAHVGCDRKDINIDK